jgi:N-acetylglucosaminyl-diphospho-decaprenol L-rhamnosyltransferase
MQQLERPTRLTAIVVTYDSATWIRPCLAALAGIPTIVIDNASRDDSVAIVRSEFPAVRLIARSDNGGFAVAVNEGCRAAPDDDIVVKPGSIGLLQEYLTAHPKVGIVVPRLVYPDGTLQTSIRAWPSPLTMLARRSPLGRTTVGRRILARHFYLDDPARSAGPVDNAIGAAMLVRRGAIREVGPMDERIFLYGEDLDWCYRMWQHGWEVHIVPDAVMEHAYERQSRRTLDLRSAATRHHWASVFKLFAIHPSLLIGRGPRRAREAIARHRGWADPAARQ